MTFLDLPGGNWDLLRTRLSTRGPDGKLLSALAGNETDAELRALVIRFTEACPARQRHSRCPFLTLNRLRRVTLRALVAGMTRSAMVSMFDLECEVRHTDAVSACLQDDGNFCGQPSGGSMTLIHNKKNYDPYQARPR